MTPTPPHDPDRTPAENLAAYRQEIGMTQREAAGLLGYAFRHYQRLEAGTTPIPKLRLDWMARRVTALRFARAAFRAILEEADRVDPAPSRVSPAPGAAD
jgi:transcriptional regulator with XRE-family HTH domain